MELWGLTGAIAALVAGLSASPHCGLMCGPLACAMGAEGRRASTALAWHLGRLGAYVSLGALAGGLGHGAVSFAPSLLRALPWLMALGLVVAAFDLPSWFQKPRPVGSASARAWRALRAPTAKLSPAGRAAAFGALTPLLPCGLLYGVLIAAAATGTALAGAAVMGAFVLGSAPALGAVQAGAFQLGGSSFGRWARRAVLVAGAAVLAYRGWHAPPNADTPPECHGAPPGPQVAR